MDSNSSEISIFVKSYWNYFLELENEFKQTQKYVSFDKYNEKTYSIEYLKLIQAACSEIDVVAKEIANHFDPSFAKISKPTIKHWGYVIKNHMPQLCNFRLCFNNEENMKFTPWNKFGYVQYYDIKNHLKYKLDDGCETPKWWQDYNKMKHNRTARNDEGNTNFTNASLKNMILSFGALYSLEVMYMRELSSEFGPDCEIPESKLFSSPIIPWLMELRRTRQWREPAWN